MSIIVPLTQGMVAVIDDEDAQAIFGLRWCAKRTKKKYYAMTHIRKDGRLRSIQMGRYLLQSPRNMLVDHINGDPLDNRRSNLRVVTVQQNNWNSSPHKRCSVPQYKGVCKRVLKTGVARYDALIRVHGKKVYLGRYATPEEAGAAYARHAEIVQGEYAWKEPCR